MRNGKFDSGTWVTVAIDSAMIKVNSASIDRKVRTTHHGEFKGIKVNSPETYQIGDSVIIWPEAGKPFAISMNKAVLGVLATQSLQSEGKLPY